MNTNPDKKTLLLWLEDELAPEDRELIDAWAGHHPDWLAKRESSRQWKSNLARVMTTAVEIPYGDFFQARLMRSLESADPLTVQRERKRPLWKYFTLPISVAAAMVLGFVGGMNWVNQPIMEASLITYTPEVGVQAEIFESTSAEGTVIVLSGVASLPDGFMDTDLSSAEALDLRDPIEKKKDTSALPAP